MREVTQKGKDYLNYAFYLKNSVWSKEEKKTKSSSEYLGADFDSATAKLTELEKIGEVIITPELRILTLEELTKAQENYAYKKAISILSKLSESLGKTKANKEICKTLEKITKAQKVYADKAQKKGDNQAQKDCDDKAQNKGDNEAQNKGDEDLQKLENEGQQVLPISESQAQKDCDN